MLSDEGATSDVGAEAGATEQHWRLGLQKVGSVAQLVRAHP